MMTPSPHRVDIDPDSEAIRLEVARQGDAVDELTDALRELRDEFRDGFGEIREGFAEMVAEHRNISRMVGSVAPSIPLMIKIGGAIAIFYGVLMFGLVGGQLYLSSAAGTVQVNAPAAP